MLALAALGCGSGGGEGPGDAQPRFDAPASAPDASSVDVGISFRDGDGDGLDDAWELEVASDYLPFLSLDPTDGCPLGGIVVRVRPHPADPARLLVLYDHLFQNDCGLNGHVGDNEAFGATIDPSIAGPDGILALRAISHQGTPCQSTTTCGRCPGLDPCTTQLVAGVPWPVVFSSKDKHGGFTTSSCTFPCFDTCTLADTPRVPPIVNVGEPTAHLVENLTTQGFITAANGWTEPALYDHDPWGTTDFGGAGSVAGDLTDAAFETPTCAP